MTNHRQNRYQQTLDAKSIAGILLREHDNVEQAIRCAERMAAATTLEHTTHEPRCKAPSPPCGSGWAKENSND